jgi:hypothetical protein
MTRERKREIQEDLINAIEKGDIDKHKIKILFMELRDLSFGCNLFKGLFFTLFTIGEWWAMKKFNRLSISLDQGLKKEDVENLVLLATNQHTSILNKYGTNAQNVIKLLKSGLIEEHNLFKLNNDSKIALNAGKSKVQNAVNFIQEVLNQPSPYVSFAVLLNELIIVLKKNGFSFSESNIRRYSTSITINLIVALSGSTVTCKDSTVVTLRMHGIELEPFFLFLGGQKKIGLYPGTEADAFTGMILLESDLDSRIYCDSSVLNSVIDNAPFLENDLYIKDDKIFARSYEGERTISINMEHPLYKSMTTQ